MTDTFKRKRETECCRGVLRGDCRNLCRRYLWWIIIDGEGTGGGEGEGKIDEPTGGGGGVDGFLGTTFKVTRTRVWKKRIGIKTALVLEWFRSLGNDGTTDRHVWGRDGMRKIEG